MNRQLTHCQYTYEIQSSVFQHKLSFPAILNCSIKDLTKWNGEVCFTNHRIYPVSEVTILHQYRDVHIIIITYYYYYLLTHYLVKHRQNIYSANFYCLSLSQNTVSLYKLQIENKPPPLQQTTELKWKVNRLSFENIRIWPQSNWKLTIKTKAVMQNRHVSY